MRSERSAGSNLCPKDPRKPWLRVGLCEMGRLPTRQVGNQLEAKILLEVREGLIVESAWGDCFAEPELFFSAGEIRSLELEQDIPPWIEEVPILSWHHGLGGKFFIQYLAGPEPRLRCGSIYEAGGGWRVGAPADRGLYLPGLYVSDAEYLVDGGITLVRFRTPRGGVIATYQLFQVSLGFRQVPTANLVFMTRFDLVRANPQTLFDLPTEDWDEDPTAPWIILDRDIRRTFEVDGPKEGLRWLDRFRPDWTAPLAYWNHPGFDLP